jgi:hypothetical protein
VLTVDTSVSAPHGAYEGHVVGTGGQTTVRTPLAVTREAESYDVKLTMVDRAGNPTPDYYVRFVDLAVRDEVTPYHESGTVVTRLPAGAHFLHATIRSFDGTWTTSLIAEPTVVVDRGTSLVLDAREALPIGVELDELDEPDAESATGEVSALRTAAWGPTGEIHTGDPDHIHVRPSSTTAPAGQFTSSVQIEAARPDGSGRFTGSPYLYHVKWSEDGRVPGDLVRRVGDSELATEHTRIAASAPDQWAAKDFVVDLGDPGHPDRALLPRRRLVPCPRPLRGRAADPPPTRTGSRRPGSPAHP